MIEPAKFFREHRVEVCFVFFCFFFYLAWAVLIPYNQGPDEDMRYKVALFIYNHGVLPFGDESEILNTTWGQSYAFQPILAYQIDSVAMGIAAAFGLAADRLFYAARFVNVLFSTGTAIVAIAIGKQFLPGKKAMLFPALICLWPEFAFISAYVNNDALAFFSAALIFYSWTLGIRRRWDKKTCILMAFGLSLCFLSYYNAYGFIFCSAFIYGGDYFLHRKERNLRRFLTYGFMILSICAVLAGWWFVRSAVLHNGDIFGMQTSSELAEQLAAPDFKPSLHQTPENQGYSFWKMLIGPVSLPNVHGHGGWIVNTGMSFLGVFSYSSIVMGKANYFILCLIVLIGCISVILKWIRQKGKMPAAEQENPLWIATLILSMIIPIVLSLYYSFFSDYQPQGRYVLTALIPLMYFVCRGYDWLDDKIRRKAANAPRMDGTLLIPVLIAGEALCTFSALCTTLYYCYL